MTKWRYEKSAENFAAEMRQKNPAFGFYGFNVFDGCYYTGTVEELNKIGCINIRPEVACASNHR